MVKTKLITPFYKDIEKSHISTIEKYEEMYQDSVENSDAFWATQANRLDWYKKWNTVSNSDFTKAEIKWFEGGKLNVSYNCLDRHVEAGFGNQTALIWEGNDPSEDKSYTYSELLIQVSKFANVLKSNSIQKGDRVCIYMQMIPELSIAMLACSRIGAVHSIVFGAFSPDSLRDRINDSTCKMLITQDTGVRGKKSDIPMKENADNALANTPSIAKVIVVKRTGKNVRMNADRDLWWHDQMATADNICVPEAMDAEDPLFTLYTSGSTGKPKGV